jgi:hypothetical protein
LAQAGTSPGGFAPAWVAAERVAYGIRNAILRLMTRTVPFMAGGLLSIAACEGQSPEQARLSESRNAWVALKSENGSSYRYTVKNSSFTGYRSETTVEVLGDRVSRRTFTSGTDTGTPDTSWLEEGAALGSHPEGAPPLTIEEVYDRCASEVLTQDSGQNVITLTFQSDGLLQDCSYFPRNCADDCAVGVRVTSLEFIQ